MGNAAPNGPAWEGWEGMKAIAILSGSKSVERCVKMVWREAQIPFFFLSVLRCAATLMVLAGNAAVSMLRWMKWSCLPSFLLFQVCHCFCGPMLPAFRVDFAGCCPAATMLVPWKTSSGFRGVDPVGFNGQCSRQRSNSTIVAQWEARESGKVDWAPVEALVCCGIPSQRVRA
jgi:hypothetical protein